MLKKLILVIMASVLFITGCQSIKGVDLNQMILNNSKVKSAESKTTVSLQLTVNKRKAKDKEFLKVVDLLNNAKLEVQTKLQNSSTASLSGNIVLQQGKIPFRMYMDKKKVVLLLDNASKPIVMKVDNSGAQDKWLQDLQTKLLSPIVKNLPNPKQISVKSATEKVHGETVKGYKVNATVNFSELPNLFIALLDNLAKDQKSLEELAAAVNELNKMTGDNSKVTAQELQEGLKQFKTEFTAGILPEMKNSGMLTKNNYLKTSILVDKKFYERKSSSTFNMTGIKDESGLTGIRIKVVNETWKINKKVTATKIRYGKYLSENASEAQFLNTLDKRRSVLYSVMTSFMYKQSAPVKGSQVKVTNNKRKADTVLVKGIKKGDVIKLYTASKGGKLLTGKQAAGTSTTLSVKQLGKKSGKVYVSIIRNGKAESARTAVKYKAEK